MTLGDDIASVRAAGCRHAMPCISGRCTHIYSPAIYDQAEEHGRTIVLDELDARFIVAELDRCRVYTGNVIQADEVRDRTASQLRRPPDP